MSTRPQLQRGLTPRSFAVCVVALFAMGVWIEYEELYNTYGGPLAENSPPNSAVGVILVLLAVSGFLWYLRKPLRLVAAELVVVYAALVLAAPLMTQGLWHRFFGLVSAIPHNQDFKSYESLPSMLWPHGPNLVSNQRFAAGLDGFTVAGGGTAAWEDIDRKGRGVWRSPVFSNGGEPAARCVLSFAVSRFDGRGHQQLVPGESFLFSMLLRSQGFAKGSAYTVSWQCDDAPAVPLFSGAEETKPTFANPEGFMRVGITPVTIPDCLRERLVFHITFTGPGRLALQDLEFFNVEAVEGLYAGRKFVGADDLDRLGPNERNFMAVRPRHLWSPEGLRYLLTGYIPLGQWVRPAIAWSVLVAALFTGFLGLNLLMRRQWVENERFTFPLTILPKQLFAEDNQRLLIFRNRVFWLGFAIALPLACAKGIKFYYPSFPAPVFAEVNFGQYFTSPILKAYLANVGLSQGGFGLGISLCLVPIALLIETEVLFSLWSMFLIFQLWNLFGRAFNFTRIPGYPWESQQAMGGFVAYALLALFVGRHHLGRVWRLVAGRGGAAGEDAVALAAEVRTYRWALILVVVSLLLLVAWGIWTQMGAGASLLFFGYLLVCGFAASKIRAEMGAPWGYLTPYYGMQFVGALGGFALFKSTGMLVATIASGFMCTSVFLLIAPAQVEMMELGRHFGVRPRDVGAGLTLGLLGGLFIGGFVLLCWAYGFGANNLKTFWPYSQNWYFGSYRAAEQNADRAFAAGTLSTTPENQPLNFAKNVDAKGLGIGVAITTALAVLRAKLAWFPFHPLGYVLASSWLMKGVWFTFLIAWLVRLVLFRLGGARMIRHGLVPFCVGMFVAAILSIVIFDVVGIYLRLQGVLDVYSKIP